MKPINEMDLSEVVMQVLDKAVNIPDGLYARAKYLAQKPSPQTAGLTHIEEVAEQVYNSWSNNKGFVTWTPGGNSSMQTEARVVARRIVGIHTSQYAQTPYPCRHHFDRLVDHCKRQDDEIAALKRELHIHNYYKQNEYWSWQSEGDNYIDSLVCPILISANDMRDVVKGVKLTSLKDS